MHRNQPSPRSLSIPSTLLPHPSTTTFPSPQTKTWGKAKDIERKTTCSAGRLGHLLVYPITIEPQWVGDGVVVARCLGGSASTPVTVFRLVWCAPRDVYLLIEPSVFDLLCVCVCVCVSHRHAGGACTAQCSSHVFFSRQPPKIHTNGHARLNTQSSEAPVNPPFSRCLPAFLHCH